MIGWAAHGSVFIGMPVPSPACIAPRRHGHHGEGPDRRFSAGQAPGRCRLAVQEGLVPFSRLAPLLRTFPGRVLRRCVGLLLLLRALQPAGCLRRALFERSCFSPIFGNARLGLSFPTSPLSFVLRLTSASSCLCDSRRRSWHACPPTPSIPPSSFVSPRTRTSSAMERGT